MFLFLVIALAYMVRVREQTKTQAQVEYNYAKYRSLLYSELSTEFSRDFHNWGAQLLPDLTIRFSTPTVLFEHGSDRISQHYKAILRDFFPRYVRVLANAKYADSIQQLRIEGSAPNAFGAAVPGAESYLGSIGLAQDRARAVLALGLHDTRSSTDAKWVMTHVTADGSSSPRAGRYHADSDKGVADRVDFKLVDSYLAQLQNPQTERVAPANATAHGGMPGLASSVVKSTAADTVGARALPVLVNGKVLFPVVIDSTAFYQATDVDFRRNVSIVAWTKGRQVQITSPAYGLIDGRRMLHSHLGTLVEHPQSADSGFTGSHSQVMFSIPEGTLNPGAHVVELFFGDPSGLGYSESTYSITIQDPTERGHHDGQ